MPQVQCGLVDRRSTRLEDPRHWHLARHRKPGERCHLPIVQIAHPASWPGPDQEGSTFLLWFLQMPHAAQMPEMNPPRQPTAAMRVPTP